MGYYAEHAAQLYGVHTLQDELVTKLEEARDALTTRSEDPAFSEEARAIYDQLANDLDRMVHDHRRERR